MLIVAPHDPVVRDVIEPGTPTLHADVPAHRAADLIIRLGLEGVPLVAAGGELVGLIASTDLVLLLAEQTR